MPGLPLSVHVQGWRLFASLFNASFRGLRAVKSIAHNRRLEATDYDSEL